jgi:hypothetical protein
MATVEEKREFLICNIAIRIRIWLDPDFVGKVCILERAMAVCGTIISAADKIRF